MTCSVFLSRSKRRSRGPGAQTLQHNITPVPAASLPIEHHTELPRTSEFTLVHFENAPRFRPSTSRVPWAVKALRTVGRARKANNLSAQHCSRTVSGVPRCFSAEDFSSALTAGACRAKPAKNRQVTSPAL